MLYTASRIGDFIRTHSGVAYKYHFVITVIGLQKLGDRYRIGIASLMSAPYLLVRAVMKVKKLQMLKFSAGRSKQLLTFMNIIIHRAAYIKKH